MRIGIYGVSSQSGKAYLADLLADGVDVYGYARRTANGLQEVEAMARSGGLVVDRPPNNIGETRRFQPVAPHAIGHDLQHLLHHSELIIVATPSLYHEEFALVLASELAGRRIALVLSPSRTLATPYLQRILGENYPIVSFQTCPYACKTFAPGTVFIKRRKQAWLATLEGDLPANTEQRLQQVFPQIVFSAVPAVNSLGNIGAVFHPAPYLLNFRAIEEAKRTGAPFSFYIDGIANNARVAHVVEQIDQIRLSIAHDLGCSVFGLRSAPREEEFAAIMSQVAALGAPRPDELHEQRLRRADALRPLEGAVVSAAHWLAYTYGVKRIPGEPLWSAIGRTPNYQSASFPQERYIHEDVPTGLVPFEALAARFSIAHGPISRVIDTYERITGIDARLRGRNLAPFDTAFLRRHLTGGAKALGRVA